VLLKESPNRPIRRFAPADQARALALVLREEFGAPFAFYDATNGEPIPGQEGDGAAFLTLPQVLRLAADGKAVATLREQGGYQVALPLHGSGQTTLVASAVLTGFAPTRVEAARETVRLQRWLQAVADRLRLADQAAAARRAQDEQNRQAMTAWEALLTLDRLLGRLRLHKEPERNQRRILQAGLAVLGARTLVWVPEDPGAAVLVEGEACLAPADCRQLAAALSDRLGAQSIEPLLVNDFSAGPWGPSFPKLGSLMAFALADQGPLGWVLAINKQAGDGREVTGFRRSDGALLTPFVSLLGLHARTFRRHQDTKNLLVGLTRSLTAALDAKDSYTYGHSERVARIAVELGKALGLQGDDLGEIYLAGLLHDVGKIGVPDAVLGKQGPLAPEEHEQVKQHVTIGYSILADLGPIRQLLPGVLYHHECVDGTGYPEGLVGDAIPLLARILAVADAYDAMSTTRPYREAMPCRRVEEILLQGAGKQWDKQIIDAFVRCRNNIHAIRQRGVGESLRHALDGALNGDGSLKEDTLPAFDLRSGAFRNLSSTSRGQEPLNSPEEPS
jgi:HD-GYP domain-containing protein (c-di-GMP phosphodiesterase class II)